MKNKAFTLIELLVVLAIICILGSVIFTAIGKFRSKKGADENRVIYDIPVPTENHQPAETNE